MSDPGSPADLNHRFAAVWAHMRHLETRISRQEMRQANSDAVSSWRRWAAPIALYTVGLALTIVSLIHH